MENEPILHIIEVFKSIQGESSFSGRPTSFIRLAGCNLRCTWCDTAYSFGRGSPYSLSAIIGLIQRNSCKNVCVTGGEPLIQANSLLLMQRLCDMGYTVSLETGGSLCTSKVDPRVHVILDIKCPESGMSHKNYWPNMENLRKDKDETKFVLVSRTDYDYAKEVAAKYKLYDRSKEVLFSPAHGTLNPELLVQWILSDCLPARLNLQIHKFIWSPETKGV